MSGDSFNVVTLKEGRELIVLSDGMGVGRKAAQESKATVNLLEELFNTGFGQEVAVKTVNSILLLRQRESFATVDLALIDLYSGEIDSIKIGGSPLVSQTRKKSRYHIKQQPSHWSGGGSGNSLGTAGFVTGGIYWSW